ncbi:Protein CBP-1 a, partial [Aphelenchoides avenae]
DYPLCANCTAARGQKAGEHQHPAENNVSLIGVDPSQSADTNNSREESTKRCVESLVHACECRDANCRRPTCHKLKKVVKHVKLCKKRQQTTCPVCKQAIALSCYNAKQCNLTLCRVPFCSSVRHKLKSRSRSASWGCCAKSAPWHGPGVATQAGTGFVGIATRFVI